VRDCSWLLRSREDFGNVRPDNFKCSSDRTRDRDDKYNCIAWAVGKKDNWWWPRQLGGFHWPRGLPREPLNKETVENFIRAFETEGFERCDDGKFENEFEKVAIYVNNFNVPKHAARLLPNGAWTSKLGDDEDIEHATLEVLEGRGYGKAKIFLRRSNPLCQKPNKLKTLFSRLWEFLRMLLKRSSPTVNRNQTSN
jgi:hypothetical protein